ncbi:isocitrate dehydrogenase [NAD] subunit gamma, mitochondrial-like [Frankliniella occidentalis]|uniref:Isocitrate dehydrogenase [NAD] subunit gamma, mitochondrial-like n=1 Tax=Frankliniella occidentalis TaxID=133901 RepID=A0A6J1SGB4_FRAOC|nr:isocitrate dehydrogenase [NAD] subunit gamma, mitochondrial-like [Frankliniella occidentalis]
MAIPLAHTGLRLQSAVLRRMLHRSGQPVRGVHSAHHAVADGLPFTKYGGRHTVTLLPGVGIGPELMQGVRKVFAAAGVPVDFEEHVLPDLARGADVDEPFEHAVLSIRRNKVALKGNIEIKGRGENLVSRTVQLRRVLDLYVYVMEARSQPGVKTARQSDVDVTLVRQNTEGEYFMLEHSPVRGAAESMKVVTAAASERVARFAFEHARGQRRPRVTVVHNKATLPRSDGLFVDVALAVGSEYPEVDVDVMSVGRCCADLLHDATPFSVVLTPNLYGVYLGAILSGLVGGPGLLAGTNYGPQAAVFEPGTRNKGTDIQGRGVANPVGMLRAAADLLHFVGQRGSAALLRTAVDSALRRGTATHDIGGHSSTDEFIQDVCDHIVAARRPWDPHTFQSSF